MFYMAGRPSSKPEVASELLRYFNAQIEQSVARSGRCLLRGCRVIISTSLRRRLLAKDIRASEHVDAEHRLPSPQSAYRPRHPTQTAVTAVHDELVRNINSGKVSVLRSLDLSSAFDTMDHDILLQFLGRRFCVKGRTMNWFDCYLADRKQSFQQGTQRSGPHPVGCSVHARGSVLGPPRTLIASSTISTS